MAMGILSGISASELSEALSMKNLSRLTAQPGVGKKTAQRLCVELQDKVSHLASHVPGEAAGSFEPQAIEGDSVQDVVSALTNLGYPQNTAWQALRKVQKKQDKPISEIELEELIRLALQVLA